MRKFRKRLIEIKEGFLDAKIEKMVDAFILANKAVINVAYLAICYVSLIFFAFNLDYISYIIMGIATLGLIFFQLNYKAFSLFMPLSVRLALHFFGRYGRVVTKKDWTKIKKECPKGYKKLFSKESRGHCYFYSRGLALFLKDAKLMYCSIKDNDGSYTAHSVIVKNGCVYCTNARRHFDLEEYKKMFDVHIYKMFSEKDYRNENFFDNIRDDFVKWCGNGDGSVEMGTVEMGTVLISTNWDKKTSKKVIKYLNV